MRNDRRTLTYTQAKKEEKLFCQYFAHVSSYAEQQARVEDLCGVTGLSDTQIERKLAYLARVRGLHLTYYYKPSNDAVSRIDYTKTIAVDALSAALPSLKPGHLDAIFKYLPISDIRAITAEIYHELENN